MRLLSAEFLKLKGTFAYLLPGAIVGFVCAISGISLVMEGYYLIRLGENPWTTLTHAGFVLFIIMLLNPFLILLVSAAYFVEQRANAWKLLYVQPANRSLQYFTKLLALLLLTVSTILLMLFGLVITGYLVDLWLPEFGFAYSDPEWGKMGRVLLHGLVSGLGVLGIQQLLSLRFRNILVPLGIGMAGFISAFLLIATGSRFALYFPYAYPMIAQDLDTIPFDYRTFTFVGLSNVELLSIGWFVLSVGLGYAYNKYRNVH